MNLFKKWIHKNLFLITELILKRICNNKVYKINISYFFGLIKFENFFTKKQLVLHIRPFCF